MCKAFIRAKPLPMELKCQCQGMVLGYGWSRVVPIGRPTTSYLVKASDSASAIADSLFPSSEEVAEPIDK